MLRSTGAGGHDPRAGARRSNATGRYLAGKTRSLVLRVEPKVSSVHSEAVMQDTAGRSLEVRDGWVVDRVPAVAPCASRQGALADIDDESGDAGRCHEDRWLLLLLLGVGALGGCAVNPATGKTFRDDERAAGTRHGRSLRRNPQAVPPLQR